MQMHAFHSAHVVLGLMGAGLSILNINDSEWAKLGHAAEEEKVRRQAKETDNQGDIFDQVISPIDYCKCELTCCQINMHVCTDKAEWERIHFFHSNGDLGIILGLVAPNKGLALGSKGLKILPNLYLHYTCSS
ncbi:hypothetical protein B0H14DRAFT_2582069 [Mycena olivaceomarginata]|nr:hypothetical protein B0H14DRAFT_2582069 [Mycena olivaceomarginata]